MNNTGNELQDFIGNVNSVLLHTFMSIIVMISVAVLVM